MSLVCSGTPCGLSGSVHRARKPCGFDPCLGHGHGGDEMVHAAGRIWCMDCGFQCARDTQLPISSDPKWWLWGGSHLAHNCCKWDHAPGYGCGAEERICLGPWPGQWRHCLVFCKWAFTIFFSYDPLQHYLNPQPSTLRRAFSWAMDANGSGQLFVDPTLSILLQGEWKLPI